MKQGFLPRWLLMKQGSLQKMLQSEESINVYRETQELFETRLASIDKVGVQDNGFAVSLRQLIIRSSFISLS